MKQPIYMLGGVDLLQGQVSPLDQQWLAEAKENPICVIDLTSSDSARRPWFRSIMKEHFSQLTDSELIFISELASRGDLIDAFDKAGAIYIPGGDTEVLLDHLAEQDLSVLIKSSNLPIAGNSAGALALCQDVVLTSDTDIKAPRVLVGLGLGLVPFSIDPHYDPTHDEELFTLSEGRDIYGLPEESGIIVKGESIEFVGAVWLFSDGEKKRVN